MNFNVFDTEAEANTAQEACFQAWKTANPAPSEYWTITTAWCQVRQRLDGKWVYRVCPDGSQTHTQEVYNSSWFADPQA